MYEYYYVMRLVVMQLEKLTVISFKVIIIMHNDGSVIM